MLYIPYYITYAISGACGSRRIAKEQQSRKRPGKCINYHPEEIEIEACGRSHRLHGGMRTTGASMAVAVLLTLVSAFVLLPNSGSSMLQSAY